MMNTLVAQTTPLPHAASALRILHVITSMDPRHGGPPEGIRQMGQILIREGHCVEVACLDESAPGGADDAPLRIYRLGPAVGKYQYSRSFVPWLRANAGRFDCVIAHDFWQYPCLAAWRALHDSPTPYFVFTHGMLDPWFQRTYPLKHLKKALYWRAAGHKILRDARAVFFTTEEEKNLAGQSFRPYRCDGVTVGFGTTGAPGDAFESKRAFLDAFPSLIGKKLVLFLGRVHPKKGLDLLIDAFARAAAHDDRQRLVIAGPQDSSYREVLERQAFALGIANRICWAGLLSAEQKWGAFHAADVFSLPSHQENFALGVTEALACGLPALISNKVNIWREIESAGAGFVGADDHAGTLQTLQNWLSLSPTDQDVMRERARLCFDRHFKIETATHALIKALRDYGVVSRSPQLRVSS